MSIIERKIYLLVDILAAYVLFYERKSPVISTKYITGLIALIKEHFGSSELDANGCMLNFRQMIGYINRKKSDSSTAELFAAINI